MLDSACLDNDFLNKLVETSLTAPPISFEKQEEFSPTLPYQESLTIPHSAVFQRSVDMAGNILWIHGKSTFKGNLINATLLSDGEVTIDGECRNCSVYSMDNIHIFRTENGQFMSFGDVHITTESNNSSFTTAGSIHADTCTVRSGRLAAASSIYIQNAYSPADRNKLYLVAGDRKILYTKLNAVTARLEHLENDLQEVTECIQIFARKIVEKRLMGVVIPQFEAVKQQKEQLQDAIADMKPLLKTIRQQATMIHKGDRIMISSFAGSGITIDIEGSRHETIREYEDVGFSTNGNEIIVRSSKS